MSKNKLRDLEIKLARKFKVYAIYFWISISIFLVMGGSMMNIKAVMFNDGRMPVYGTFSDGEVIDSDMHFSFFDYADVSYPHLTDIYYIDIANTEMFFSLGDIMVWFGSIFSIIMCGILIYKTLMYKYGENTYI